MDEAVRSEVGTVDEMAEELLGRTKLARRVPAEAREQIHAILRRPVGERADVTQVWRDLRLKERFGVGEHTFKEYARQFRVLDEDVVRGRLLRELAELLLIPSEYEEPLRQHGRTLLMTRLGKALQAEDLGPTELAKLAEALLKAQAAASQAADQKRKAKRARLEERALRAQIAKGKPLTDEVLYTHIQRIYGVSMNGWVRPEARERLARERLKELAKQAGVPKAKIAEWWGETETTEGEKGRQGEGEKRQRLEKGTAPNDNDEGDSPLFHGT